MTQRDHRSTRRTFLKRTALGSGLALGWPAALQAAPSGRSLDAPALPAEARVVLFQGDSITDAGRNKQSQRPNQPGALGSGYAGLAAAQLMAENPGTEWECYNRGISGNKVFQLAERWQADCLDLQPAVLSILIGVNDYWHTLTGGYDGTAAVYEKDYRALLDRTKEALPDVRLIIAEPFTVAGGTAIDQEAWYPAFEAYQKAARAIADDYGAVWIPYQSIFAEALDQAPAAYWCPDGVHPAPAGNYLMAQAWLSALETALGQPR
jgi:lysophospholipase L1-like esterase